MSLSRFLYRLAHDCNARTPQSGAPFLFPAALATVLILLDDVVLRRAPLPYVLVGLTDEPAHALTALLAVAALITHRAVWDERAVWWGALLGCTFIDLDHVPGALGWNGIANAISDGTARPYSHSLLSLVLVLAVGVLLRGARRRVGLAAGLGLAAHLLRDLVDGGTVSLLWPVTKHGFSMPYDDYAACLLLCLAWIIHKPRLSHGGGTPLPAVSESGLTQRAAGPSIPSRGIR